MFRNITVNLSKCRHMKFADSFISKYNKFSSGTQKKFIQPVKSINGQYLVVISENCLLITFIYTEVSTVIVKEMLIFIRGVFHLYKFYKKYIYLYCI